MYVTQIKPLENGTSMVKGQLAKTQKRRQKNKNSHVMFPCLSNKSCNITLMSPPPTTRNLGSQTYNLKFVTNHKGNVYYGVVYVLKHIIQQTKILQLKNEDHSGVLKRSINNPGDYYFLLIKI